MIYKKLLVALLLVQASTSAMAEDWIYVGRGDIQNVAYAKPSSISIHGNIATMWLIQDYKYTRSLVDVKYSSMKTRDEYDCKQEQSRTVSAAFYSGKMATGKVVYSYNESDGEWFPVSQNSLGSIMLDVACASLESSQAQPALKD
jgi:Surface-adhesin protein E